MPFGPEAGALDALEAGAWAESPMGSDLISPLLNSEASCSPGPRKGSPWAEAPPQHSLREQCTWKRTRETMGLGNMMVMTLALLAGVVLGAVLTAYLPSTGTEDQVPAPQTVDQSPYALAVPPLAVPLAYMVSPGLNNSCLLPNLAIPDGPQSFDACSFVVQSTDEIWNLRRDVDAAIETYFHEDYVDAGSWGRRIIGKTELRDAILLQMRAFPDIQIHITDCSCQGNDIDGYKCAMPDILTGTNTGPSSYGPATGKTARWTGMVQSWVKRNPNTDQWQYFAEWGVHDEWSLLQQLGLDFARIPHPETNSEPLHDCFPLLQFQPGPEMDASDFSMQQAHDRATALRRKFI